MRWLNYTATDQYAGLNWNVTSIYTVQPNYLELLGSPYNKNITNYTGTLRPSTVSHLMEKFT